MHPSVEAKKSALLADVTAFSLVEEVRRGRTYAVVRFTYAGQPQELAYPVNPSFPEHARVRLYSACYALLQRLKGLA